MQVDDLSVQLALAFTPCPRLGAVKTESDSENEPTQYDDYPAPGLNSDGADGADDPEGAGDGPPKKKRRELTRREPWLH